MPLKLIEQSLYTQKEKEKKYQITVPYGKYPFLENKYLAIFDCYKLLRRQSKCEILHIFSKYPFVFYTFFF